MNLESARVNRVAQQVKETGDGNRDASAGQPLNRRVASKPIPEC